MKGKTLLIIAVLVLLTLGTGALVYKVVSKPKSAPVSQAPSDDQSIPQVDASVMVDLTKSTSKPDTVVVGVKGLAGKYVAIAYELTYDSEGLIKGVNSGSKPIDTTGQNEFDREVYLGTCSRNVCKPDKGVSKISLVLEFTDTKGAKSQFSHDYPL